MSHEIRQHPAAQTRTKRFSLTMCGWLVIWLAQAALGGQDCPAAAIPTLIADPGTWVQRCCATAWGADTSRPAALEEFARDFDQDGAAERFITCAAARGSAGSTYYVFRAQGTAYRYLGSLFLHPKAFRILPSGSGTKPTIVLYHRLGAAEGFLETVSYEGGAFVTVAKEKVDPTGAGAARLHQLFGDAFAAPPASGLPPPISLPQALESASRYVTEHRIDLSGQFLQSITLQLEAAGEHRGHYWLVQWSWSQPRLGGEFSLRLFMDGTIEARRLGP